MHASLIPLRFGQVAIPADDAGLELQVLGECLVTGAPYELRVPADGLRRWLGGELIQRALPAVSAPDREFLLTGYSPAGWEQLFGGDDAGEP